MRVPEYCVKGAIIILLFFTVFTSASNAQNLALATGEWVPYTSNSLESKGEFTRKVTIVLKEMGIKPDYRFYPWKRCFKLVKVGKVWAAFPYSFTKERAESVWYSDMLGCSKTVFFYYENAYSPRHYQFRNLEDLKPYKITGVLGYFYEKSFEDAGLNVEYFYKEIEALKILKNRSYDLMALNRQVGENLIQTHFPGDADKFKTLAKPLSSDPLMLVVSKKYPGSKDLLDRFNAALKKCTEKGLISIEPCVH